MSDPQISGEIRPFRSPKRSRSVYLTLCRHHVAFLAGRARWAEAGAPAPLARHAGAKTQSDSGFKKCARIVGDVMGKYHPHGDAAIYDAMVRLAQDFAVRYPLVDGQGNFGNIDGDNAAAMPTRAADDGGCAPLLEGIDEDAVGFRNTYDGEGSEPVVLPANFPNLATARCMRSAWRPVSRPQCSRNL